MITPKGLNVNNAGCKPGDRKVEPTNRPRLNVRKRSTHYSDGKSRRKEIAFLLVGREDRRQILDKNIFLE
jgi:hypothetical protein